MTPEPSLTIRLRWGERQTGQNGPGIPWQRYFRREARVVLMGQVLRSAFASCCGVNLGGGKRGMGHGRSAGAARVGHRKVRRWAITKYMSGPSRSIRPAAADGRG